MPLSQTANTRSSLTPTHLLHTPESFVRTPMPGLAGGLAIVHACPALGADFFWYTLELTRGGVLAANTTTRLLYVLTGSATLGGNGIEQAVEPGCYAFSAASSPLTVTATTSLTAVVIEKKYEPLAGILQSDPVFIRREPDLSATPLNNDPGLLVRALIPANDFQFDFAVNTMAYAPGAALSQVEVHYMEHGLLMLEGDGLYLLGTTWYPVQAGDFVWMAPFCPQQFQAGPAGAKYLIYKNFNRTPSQK